MGFDKRGIIGSDTFVIKYLSKSNIELDFYLHQFNIDNYFIFKNSAHFKHVSIKDFLDFKYAGYIFFKKDKYKLDDILKWIDYIKKNKIVSNYFSKPFPPIEVMNKIKIIDKI